MRGVLLGLVLAGCAPEPEGCGEVASREIALVRRLAFAGADGKGRSPGFDLDGVDSGPGDDAGCRHADWRGLEGERGIDNAVAALMPALELVGGAAINELVQEAIDGGQLLLFVELSRLDDPWDDGCVDVALSRGLGAPRLGGDGSILPGQTYDRDPSRPGATVRRVALEGGALVAGPFDLVLPVALFDQSLELTVRGARLGVDVDDEGGLSGVLAGGLAVAELVAYASTVDETIARTLVQLLPAAGDLDADGDSTCEQISVVLTWEGTSAFFFDDPAR